MANSKNYRPWDLKQLRLRVRELIEAARSESDPDDISAADDVEGAAETFIHELVEGSDSDPLLGRPIGRRFVLSWHALPSGAAKATGPKWRERLGRPSRLLDDELCDELLLDALVEIGPQETDALALILKWDEKLISGDLENPLPKWSLDPPGPRRRIESKIDHTGAAFDMRDYFRGEFRKGAGAL